MLTSRFLLPRTPGLQTHSTALLPSSRGFIIAGGRGPRYSNTLRQPKCGEKSMAKGNTVTRIDTKRRQSLLSAYSLVDKSDSPSLSPSEVSRQDRAQLILAMTSIIHTLGFSFFLYLLSLPFLPPGVISQEPACARICLGFCSHRELKITSTLYKRQAPRILDPLPTC